VERIGGAIIGGGAVGCAVLLELARAGLKDLFLFEKQPYLADQQSGRNSGVVHAGIYYDTGSNKATLCVEANELIYSFCEANGVPVDNVGKLVVATKDSEIERLDDVYRQALENNVPGVRLLNRHEVHEIEPNVHVVAALYCPTTGVVEAGAYTHALARRARELGAQTLVATDVISVEPVGDAFHVTTRRDGRSHTVVADLVVNAAGHGCGAIARMINPDVVVEHAPLRGEYYKFNRRSREDLWLNGANIYPVPQMVDIGGEEVETVGAHLTPTFAIDRSGHASLGDTVIVGPEMTYVQDPEDFETDRAGPELFLERARCFFPSLRLEDLHIDFAGVMVKLKNQPDWIIERDARHSNAVQLLGIDSPGLTSSLAIGRRVRSLLTGSTAERSL
jgi:L-2-hydroxyglutarate oxidase LhgO